MAFPRPGDVFKIDPSFSPEAQQIRLKAENLGAWKDLRWSVDGKTVPSGPEGTAWWRLSGGRHRARVRVLRESGWIESSAPAFFVAGDR